VTFAMSDPKDRAYLLDMREFATQVLMYLRDRTHDDFMTDRLLRDGVAYNLQVVGEAAYQVSDAFKATHRRSTGSRSPDCAIASFTTIAG